MDNKIKRSRGAGLVSTLTILFIILKITGVLSWPWIWVLSPIWITLIVAIVLFGLVLIIGRVKKGKW